MAASETDGTPSPPPDAEPRASSEPNPDAAAPSTPAAAEGGAGERSNSPFLLARRLVEQKVPRADALAQLKATGLDDEAARVALNAVDGANPSDLPDATLAPGINPLTPGSFALSDIGMSGNPAVVALYWMAFGAVVLLLVTLLLVLPELGVGEPLTEASVFWGRFGMGLGALAFGWGVFRLLLSVRVRRRPKD